MEVELRAAVDEDGPAVLEMIGEVLASYGLALDPEGTDADLVAIERSYFDRGGCFELLEDGAGRVVGSWGLAVHARRADGSPEVFELRKMYLRAELRGLGWGRRMLERALEIARERGAAAVILETASVLVEARKLYEAYGFGATDACPPAARCDLTLRLEL